MPDCPPRNADERKSDRWEMVVGKALKDWVTAVMMERKITRAEAREFVLAEIRQKGVGNEGSTSQLRTERIRNGSFVDYCRSAWGWILAHASRNGSRTSTSANRDLHERSTKCDC